MPEPAIAVIGEALVDLVPTGAERMFIAIPGGSPANVAVGLARLGVPARMLARIAEDSFGRLLRAHLASNDVDLTHCVRAGERSSLAIVSREENGGGSEYDFRVDGTADWQWTDDELRGVLDDDVVALHAGSLAVTMPPGGEAVRRLLHRAADRATVSYDPNCRPLLMGSPDAAADVISECVASADIVKGSADDLAWLYPGRTPEAIAAQWLALGPAMVIITLGPAGALAMTRTAGEVRCEGLPVDVVDTVGAGDSFTSALLAGLLRKNLLGVERRAALRDIGAADMRDVMRLAVRASAITASRQGADPPRLADLEARS